MLDKVPLKVFFSLITASCCERMHSSIALKVWNFMLKHISLLYLKKKQKKKVRKHVSLGVSDRSLPPESDLATLYFQVIFNVVLFAKK